MLIFGGTGFLGKHLCSMLHRQGVDNVTVVSREPDRIFLDDHAPSIGSIRLADFFENVNALNWDQRNIVYMAGTSTPGTFADAPWREFSENVAPALELFTKLHRTFPQAKIIYVSSGGTVYGGGHTSPIPESAPLRPISPYGLGKVAIEQALEFLGRTNSLGYEILRVSNPVGRWQVNATQGVVNVMARAVMSNAPIRLIGDGSFVRDFLDADDVASAIISVCNLPEATNTAWNVGSGTGTTIAEVVQLIEERFHRKADLHHYPARALDVHYSVLDCRKASQQLNWSSHGHVGDMIDRLAEFGLDTLG